MSPSYRRLLKASRYVHVYLTLFGLALILFFSITGFMLNHEGWFFLDEPRLRQVEGSISLKNSNPVDKFEVSEALRRTFGIEGAVNSFRSDDQSIEVEYLRPGGRTVAEVVRETGQTTVTFDTRGWAGIMTDLHKGKSAGWVWSLVIDGVCVLLLIISATGLVLWSSLKTRARWGALVMLAGGLVALAIYYWLVP